jgi:hypothetical protein
MGMCMLWVAGMAVPDWTALSATTPTPTFGKVRLCLHLLIDCTSKLFPLEEKGPGLPNKIIFDQVTFTPRWSKDILIAGAFSPSRF